MDAFSILTGGTNLKKRKTQESKRKEGTLCLYSFLEKNQHCHQADQKESTINVESEEKITSSAPTEEEIKNFQRLFRIRVSGDDVPDPIMTFSAMSKQLQFPSFLLKNLEKYGFKTPTPVQIQAIPISAAGRDLFVCSPTGSGKTLAFIIPMLADLKKHSDHGFRALIVTPVNELSKQVSLALSCSSLIIRFTGKSNGLLMEKNSGFAISRDPQSPTSMALNTTF
ncbi:unnamed protein product [Pneumocystis jirovecii]|uniref:RNA helicase n=1 Tax=Pneumocystis jirovecii TaxID=42068 RepID=L0PDR2_PNEJI|nr:unnamed protein product [Pneumocystis jirovecii]